MNTGQQAQALIGLSTLTLAVRCANEGIPIAAIARVLQSPFEYISQCLTHARKLGAITEVPKPDWPTGTTSNTRSPTLSGFVADVEFTCRKTFRLTNLEAGFLVVLLRMAHADKEKLRLVIEQQRATRQFRPDKQEVSDPKMVDVMICKLRKKLKAIDPALVIRTNWGKGYYLEQDVKDRILTLIGA